MSDPPDNRFPRNPACPVRFSEEFMDDRDIDVFWTLRFHLSYNTGMAFSCGQDWGPLIGVVALVIVVVLLLSVKRTFRSTRML